MDRARRNGLITAGVALAALTLAFAAASAAPSGALRFVELEENAALSSSTDAHVSRDGKNVYGVGFNSAIGVFSRNANTGAVTFVEAQSGDGLLSPESIIVSRDGDNAYVTGNDSNSVHSYTRAANGALSFLDSDAGAGMSGANDLVAVGNHVYVTGSNDNAVVLFNRAGDGSLQSADAFVNGSEGIEDMLAPSGITVSPNGRNVYVTSDDSNAVVVFTRSTSTGELDFVESEELPNDGNDAEVSADGTRVYVAHDSGVSTYRRNTATGALTFIGLTVGPSDDEEPLSLVFGLAATPGGEEVYATSGNVFDGVATLKTRRNGALRYFEFDSANELDGARALDLSPDARHVYVAGGGIGDGKIGVYSRQPELTLSGRKRQKAAKLKVKAECSADCKVTLKGKGLKTAKEQLKAGKPEKVRLKFKGDEPSGGKVVIKGKAKAGDRSDTDKMKVKLK